MAAIGCRPEPGSRLAEGHPKGLALTPARTAPHWPARMQVVLMRSERLVVERAGHTQYGARRSRLYSSTQAATRRPRWRVRASDPLEHFNSPAWSAGFNHRPEVDTGSVTAVPCLGSSWRTPNTYLTAGIRRGTATSTSTRVGTTSVPLAGEH